MSGFDKKLLKKIVEALLLASHEPLSIKRMVEIFAEHAEKPDEHAIQVALDTLATECDGHGYELQEVATGWRFQVRQELALWVGRLWEEKPVKYSRAVLETLALIAYRQPITRGDIEDIRGVSVGTSIIKTLMERQWVRVVAYRDVPGRPALFATTRQFLDYFNLKSLDQLPAFGEIRDFNKINAELDFEKSQKIEQILVPYFGDNAHIAPDAEALESDNIELM